MNSWGEKLVVAWAWISTVTLVGGIAVVIGFLLRSGLPAINLHLIFGDTPPWAALLLQQPVFDGLLPAMVGTLFLVLTAVGLAMPVGIGTGIYLAEYSRGRTKQILSLVFDILAGLPSIVVGLAGFSLAIFLHHHFSRRIYPCLLISAVSLAFLVLPYLIRSTQTALENLPLQERITAPAMGATKVQNIFLVLIPGALDGIVTGIILSIGRCAEDTAVIMLTGAVATAGIPNSLLGSYEALPFYIYYISSQYMNQQELQTGYAAAVILLLICSAFFALSMIIKKCLAGRLHGRYEKHARPRPRA